MLSLVFKNVKTTNTDCYVYHIMRNVRWTRDRRYTPSPLKQDFELDPGPFIGIFFIPPVFYLLPIVLDCLIYILQTLLMWIKQQYDINEPQ